MTTNNPKPSYRWFIILAALIIAAAILLSALFNSPSFQRGFTEGLNTNGALATYQAVQTMTADEP